VEIAATCALLAEGDLRIESVLGALDLTESPGDDVLGQVDELLLRARPNSSIRCSFPRLLRRRPTASRVASQRVRGSSARLPSVASVFANSRIVASGTM
jgi:hypothetical protein